MTREESIAIQYLNRAIEQQTILVLGLQACIAYPPPFGMLRERIGRKYEIESETLHTMMNARQNIVHRYDAITPSPLIFNSALDALVGKQVQLRVENIEGVQTGRVQSDSSEWINRITSVDTGFEPDPHEIALQMGRDCSFCKAKAGVKCHNLALGTTMDKPHKER